MANSYQADDEENGDLAITMIDQGNGKGSAGWNHEHSSGSAAYGFFGIRDQKEARARAPCSKTCASSWRSRQSRFQLKACADGLKIRGPANGVSQTTPR